MVSGVQTTLALARTTVALMFTVYASWSDYKTREVENIVWILFAPLAFALTLVELVLYWPSQLLLYGVCFGLTAVFAVVLFYAGGFGGADAKALMCIALALPFYPLNEWFAPMLGEPTPVARVFFPLTIFSNAVILVFVPVLWIVARNLLWRRRSGRKLFEDAEASESLGKKILVLITGYRMPISRLKEKWHIYPLEDIEDTSKGAPKRTLVVLPKEEGRDAVVGRLETAISNGAIKDEVWASPGLPMLILITAGVVVALFFGDIVWTVIGLLVR
jgi:preflagellin peptidase FlaK